LEGILSPPAAQLPDLPGMNVLEWDSTESQEPLSDEKDAEKEQSEEPPKEPEV